MDYLTDSMTDWPTDWLSDLRLSYFVKDCPTDSRDRVTELFNIFITVQYTLHLTLLQMK